MGRGLEQLSLAGRRFARGLFKSLGEPEGHLRTATIEDLRGSEDLHAWHFQAASATRGGMKLQQDPFTARPHILIYARQRFGGQSSGDFDSRKLLKVSTS